MNYMQKHFLVFVFCLFIGKVNIYDDFLFSLSRVSFNNKNVLHEYISK